METNPETKTRDRDVSDTQTCEWERVTDFQGKLVYWKRSLPDKSYLAVSRVEEGWQWAHRGPQFGWLDEATTKRGYPVQAEGRASSSTIARRQADRHVGPFDQRCPHGCGPLADGGSADHLICPACGDEWPTGL